MAPSFTTVRTTSPLWNRNPLPVSAVADPEIASTIAPATAERAISLRIQHLLSVSWGVASMLERGPYATLTGRLRKQERWPGHSALGAARGDGERASYRPAPNSIRSGS